MTFIQKSARIEIVQKLRQIRLTWRQYPAKQEIVLRTLNTLWLVLALVINFAGCGEDLYGISKQVVEDPPSNHSIDVPDADHDAALNEPSPTDSDAEPDAEATPEPEAIPDATHDATKEVIDAETHDATAPDASIPEVGPETWHSLNFSWNFTGYDLNPEIANLAMTVQCEDEEGDFRRYDWTEPVQREWVDGVLEVFNIEIVVEQIKDTWDCYALLSENETQARLSVPQGNGFYYFDDGESFPAPLYLVPGPFFGTWGPLSPSPQ